MKNKILTAALFLSLASCAKPLDGLNGFDGADGVDGAVGATGPTGANGLSCTVTQGEVGALITCPDGTSALILNGKDATKHPNNGHHGEGKK